MSGLTSGGKGTEWGPAECVRLNSLPRCAAVTRGNPPIHLVLRYACSAIARVGEIGSKRKRPRMLLHNASIPFLNENHTFASADRQRKRAAIM